MFYSLVKRNSKRNRKENGLFFVSLVISIVAFYIILSLKEQDVILFLKTMESDAVNKLLLLIPALYGLSLFILFFLVYFAGKYQLDRRNKELGMYLMLGMKRSKLLLMLFAEELWNSVLSIIIGIPVAVFISEIISLVTAKIVGLGVIGHHFSLSLSAIAWTIVGYFIIRFAALIILSSQIAGKEINELLSDSQIEKKREINKKNIMQKLIIGILLLAAAFTLGIKGDAFTHVLLMYLAFVLGVGGLFSLFHGIGVLFEMILKKKNNVNGLNMFTFRQLQESVFLKPNTMAISSLLFMMAVSCFAYGIPVGYLNNAKETHVIDYTFDTSKSKAQSVITKLNLDNKIENLFEMKTGDYSMENFSMKEVSNAVKKQPDSIAKDNFLANDSTYTCPALISVSSYNHILTLQGKKPLDLKDNEAAIYQDPEFQSSACTQMLESALQENPAISLDGKELKLIDKTFSDSIVTDSLVTLSMAFIVQDEIFNKYTKPDNIHIYINAVLNKDLVNEKGLLQSFAEVNKKLNTADIRYESYLQNMGRELFYTVAASYTTIYLAVIFLIITNTLMGVQFLMHQQKTRKRYQTLTFIGGTYEMLCKSARKQITWYFSLSIIVGAICSIFAVRSLFTGVVTANMKSQTSKLMMLSIPVIIFICVIELLYMHFVKKSSDRSILKLMDIKREDN